MDHNQELKPMEANKALFSGNEQVNIALGCGLLKSLGANIIFSLDPRCQVLEIGQAKYLIGWIYNIAGTFH